MKFSVVTFGCRANQADSFRLEEELCGRGHLPVAAGVADLVVVNTCAVTASAEASARQAIRRLARLNPSVRIALTGCYATRLPDALGHLPNVAVVLPNNAKTRVGEILGPDGSVPCTRPSPGPGRRGRTVYPLLAQTGCDAHCSYCIVPSTRGPSVSRPLEALRAEARRLSAAGYREILLTGVHLGSWGRDLTPRRTLPDLLSALQDLPGDITVRLSSIEPMDCSPAMVDALASSRGRIAPHLHLPLQHASDRVLAAMRRPYTFDQFRRLADGIKARIPDAAIGTDVMAGFPGETEAEALLLERALTQLPLAYAHVFAYSSRPGTEAARLEPKVPGDEIRRRARRLAERAGETRRRFEAGQVGATRPALTLGDGTVALTDNYVKVSIPPGRGRNERIVVRVTAADPLQAEVIA